MENINHENLKILYENHKLVELYNECDKIINNNIFDKEALKYKALCVQILKDVDMFLLFIKTYNQSDTLMYIYTYLKTNISLLNNQTPELHYVVNNIIYNKCISIKYYIDEYKTSTRINKSYNIVDINTEEFFLKTHMNNLNHCKELYKT